MKSNKYKCLVGVSGDDSDVLCSKCLQKIKKMDIKIKICVSELSLSQVLFPINHLRTAQMDLVTLLKDPTPHLKTGIRLKQQPGGLLREGDVSCRKTNGTNQNIFGECQCSLTYTWIIIIQCLFRG